MMRDIFIPLAAQHARITPSVLAASFVGIFVVLLMLHRRYARQMWIAYVAIVSLMVVAPAIELLGMPAKEFVNNAVTVSFLSGAG